MANIFGGVETIPSWLVPQSKAQNEAAGMKYGEDFTRAFEAARAEKTRKAEADRAYNERKLEYQTDKEFKQAQLDLQRKRADVQNQVEGLQLQREHMALDQATQAAADAPLLMDATHQFSRAKTVDELHSIEPPDFKSPNSLKQWEQMKAQTHNQILQTDVAKGQEQFNTEVKTAISKFDPIAQTELFQVMDPKKPMSAQSPEFFTKLIEFGKGTENRMEKRRINEIQAKAIAAGKIQEGKEAEIDARLDKRAYNAKVQKWTDNRDRFILNAVSKGNPKDRDKNAAAASDLYDKQNPKPTAPVSKTPADPLGLGIGAKPTTQAAPEGQTDGDGQNSEDGTDDE